MKVLVTGGCGYIGSHAVIELLDKGYEVVIVDDLSTGKEFLKNKKATFCLGSICDFDFMDKVFSENKIDAVINFAAKLVVPESVSQPIEYFENNVNGVLTLIKVMNKHNVKKIIFSSTAATYGEPDPKLVPIKEDSVTSPINPYGSSKLAAEFLIKGAAQAYGIKYVIFRYFNVAGADEKIRVGLSSEKITHLIPSTIEAALGYRDMVKVFGNDYPTRDGSCIRDYVHVVDLVRAHILGLEYLNAGKPSEVINLGLNEGTTVLEIIAAVEKVTGLKVPYKLEGRRPGDPAILTSDNTKAKELLNWTNTYDIEDIVKTDYLWRQKLKNEILAK